MKIGRKKEELNRPVLKMSVSALRSAVATA